MSGGHFNYDQYRIEDIAHEIQDLIDSNESKDLDDWGYPIGREYIPEVIEELKTAVKYLKLAQIYAHRVDWLVSGDDGEEQFLKRLKEEIDEVNQIKRDEPRPLEKLHYLQHQREITDRLFKGGKAHPMSTYEFVGSVLSELEEIVREE